MNRLNAIISILTGFIITQVCMFKIGERVGYSAGVCATLDTVNTALEKQVNSDTSVTRLILINPDTSVYILSRKTIQQH
jgi:hypothetical protein